jgi:hypothetical protein
MACSLSARIRSTLASTASPVRESVEKVGGFKRDTTTLVMQAQLPTGMRRHDDVVRTSIASASRAGDEPVPAVDRNRA